MYLLLQAVSVITLPFSCFSANKKRLHRLIRPHSHEFPRPRTENAIIADDLLA